MLMPSIFLGQHDGDHPLGHIRIGRVGRVDGQALVVVIDLEKDFVPVRVERAKVVFFMRVVGATKVVVDLDGLDDPGHGLWAERRDAALIKLVAADMERVNTTILSRTGSEVTMIPVSSTG